jgi:hypothetical protein
MILNVNKLTVDEGAAAITTSHNIIDTQIIKVKDIKMNSQEIITKLSTIDADIAAARQLLKAATDDNAQDTATELLLTLKNDKLKLPELLKAALLSENKDKITVALDKLAVVVVEAIKGLDLMTLTGQAFTGLSVNSYTVAEVKDNTGAVVTPTTVKFACVYNPVKVIAAKTAKASTDKKEATDKAAKHHREQVQNVATGELEGKGKFVMRVMPDAVARNTRQSSADKYPYILVDTQGKLNKLCEDLKLGEHKLV